jgi:hypothetical protein
LSRFVLRSRRLEQLADLGDLAAKRADVLADILDGTLEICVIRRLGCRVSVYGRGTFGGGRFG